MPWGKGAVRQDDTSWTDDRVATLKAYAADGTPYSQFAERYGLTYSTVRAKARRLGLRLREVNWFDWTAERIETLEALWADGLSASEIAKRFGTTRNAVIGKVHRLGLPGRAVTTKTAKGPRALRRPPKRSKARFPFGEGQPSLESPPPEPLPYTPEPFIPLAERKSLMQLNDKDCRWPIGDPQMPDFHFCAKAKVSGLPYCEVHSMRAYQLDPPKRIGLPSGPEQQAPAPSKTPAVDEFMEAMA